MALLKTAQDVGAPSRIVEAVAEVNERRKAGWRKNREAFGTYREKQSRCSGSPSNRTRTTCVMRRASSFCRSLFRRAQKFAAYDPEGMSEAKKHLDVELCEDAYQALDGADGVVSSSPSGTNSARSI
jgi:UDPglucose 6-dehydrogenase